MKDFLLGVGAAFVLAVGMVTFHSVVNAQVVGPPTPGPRFWMSDYTEVGGGDSYHIWMLHDNKYREVCFLVVEKPGFREYSLVMTPRQC